MDNVYILNEGFNRRIWVRRREGDFSVTSFFQAISDNGVTSSLVDHIWNLKAPPQVLAFGRLGLPWRHPYDG